MKETDRSLILRAFAKFDPLDHGGQLVTVEQPAEPSFDRMVLRFSFDYEGNLTDFGARKVPGIADYE